MKTETITLPAHWASALINGDLSGYDSDDLEAIRLFTRDMVKGNGSCRCIDVTEHSDFMKYHDAEVYGVLACEASTFTFDVTPN